MQNTNIIPPRVKINSSNTHRNILQQIFQLLTDIDKGNSNSNIP